MESGLDVVDDWHSQSPDLKIIEKLWAILQKRVIKRNPKNLEALWCIIQEEFFKTGNETIQKLYHSIPRRINAVIANRGYPTKY